MSEQDAVAAVVGRIFIPSVIAWAVGAIVVYGYRRTFVKDSSGKAEHPSDSAFEAAFWVFHVIEKAAVLFWKILIVTLGRSIDWLARAPWRLLFALKNRIEDRLNRPADDDAEVTRPGLPKARALRKKE